MVRSIRFIRMWRGKTGRNDDRDRDMTFGQRELLVRRGIAEWADGPEPAPKERPRRKGAAPAA